MSEAAPFLAYHFEHGGDCARAVTYLRVAAETAGRRYAPREATAHLRHALELSGRLPDAERATNELAILERLASMYVFSFDSRAVETYEMLAVRAAACGLIYLEVKALRPVRRSREAGSAGVDARVEDQSAEHRQASLQVSLAFFSRLLRNSSRDAHASSIPSAKSRSACLCVRCETSCPTIMTIASSLR